jgi:putative phosphoesterase
MRIGFLADIHADPEALRAALKLLKTKEVDEVICAGDLVERGPGGDAVVEMLEQRGILSIAGNHDVNAVNNQQWYRENTDPVEFMLEGRLLTDATLDYLKRLPNTLTVAAGDQQILVAHGAPWSNLLYVFPGSPRRVFDQVSEQTKAAGASAVILGHTHLPMAGQVDGVWILNPGSVCGTYASGSRTCGVLTLPDYTFEVFGLEDGQPVRTARPVHEYLD